MKTLLTLGKLRGMQQCSSERGTFTVMALDHRQGLRRAINPRNPDAVSDADLTAFKLEVTAALAPLATSALLDPEFSAAQAVTAGCLPGGLGLVVAVEATGYTGDPAARHSRILDGWSVAKAKRMGASAVKLLVYYHPDASTAGEIEAFVAEVAAECAAHDIALMLEPLSYPPDPARGALTSEERRRVVIESARRLTLPGVDLLKAEFPLDAAAQPDEAEWAAACRELTAASRAPWILLSGAVNFPLYLRQARVACEAGAAGIAVGRAVWKEAVDLTGEARGAFLRETARPRLARLSDLCRALGKPWTDYFAPAPVGTDWHKTYAG